MMNDNPIEDEDQPVLKKIRKKSGEVFWVFSLKWQMNMIDTGW